MEGVDMHFFARKGQIVVTDLILGSLVFVVAILAFYRAEVNLQEVASRELADVQLEAGIVADALYSRGYPPAWTNATVTDMGITENSRVNVTKLAQLRAMQYNQTRNIFRTKYDYYFYYEQNDGPTWIDAGVQEGIGKPGVNSTNILTVENPEQLARIIRFVIYNGAPHRMVVYVWKP
ncbi:hypothetical protein HY772_08550 [Candidatus Woesearchaeota archaeon]|nr:hypothetical protein [Candidatus Woesearchaeota archaeon]